MTAPIDNQHSNGPDDRPVDQPDFVCLAIEMATGAGSVAACDGTQTSSREFPEQALQSREIYSAVRDVLGDLRLELEALQYIAFGCGPGGFTGLRVAAAVTQALAYGAGIPVVRVSSLAALAAGAARKHRVDCIAPCFDARMGEVYLAVYTGSQVNAPCAAVPDCLVDPRTFNLPSELHFFAAGPGWSAIPDLIDNHAAQIVASDVTLTPSAVDVLALATEHFRAGHTVSAEQALPNYIRDKVTS